jgi:hypothetical protein
MDTPHIPSPDQEEWAKRLMESLGKQQACATEFLEAFTQRLEQAEACVEEHIQELEQEIEIDREEIDRLTAAHDALAARVEEAESQSTEAETRAAEAEARAAGVEPRVAEAESRAAEAETRLADFEGKLAEAEDRVTEAEARATEAEARVVEAEAHVAELEQLQSEASADKGDGSADEDLQRRLEMALEELKEAKAKNNELQQQLSKARSSAAKLAQHTREPGWIDWETEKRRILAALEADEGEGGGEGEGVEDEAKKSERLGIEEVLRMTDEVIASKDQEIQELKQQLEEQARLSSAAAAESATIKQAINSDEAIHEERERLQQLQKEWLEKLRQAEVSLSLERAKIARERADMEEQLRTLKDASPKSSGGAGGEGQGERSVRGRWLAQLGLSAADREPRRH